MLITNIFRKYQNVIVFIILFVYFVYFLCGMLLRTYSFGIGKLDSATYQTALWQAGQFQNPTTYLSFGNNSELVTHPFIGLHFMPIGYVYGLIYRFFPSLYATAFLYSVAFTIAGFFVYLAIRSLTQSTFLSLALLAVYLSVYTPALPVIYPIEDWATPFFAIALFLTVNKRYKQASLVFVLAMMHKEYYGLAVAALGIMMCIVSGYTLWRQHIVVSFRNFLGTFWRVPQVKAGISWFVLGSVWFFVSFFIIMRLAEPNWASLVTFSDLGSSVQDIASNIAAHPNILLERIFSGQGLAFLFGFFLPLAFLPLLGLEYTFALLPILLINFLANGSHATTNMLGHYTTMFMPFLILGSASGIVRLKTQLGKLPILVKAGVVVCLTVVISVNAIQGLRFHFFRLRESAVLFYTLTMHTHDTQSILSVIPGEASVAADEPLLPYLSFRKSVLPLRYVASLRPQYIIRDALYDNLKSYTGTIESGLALNLKVFKTPAEIFYNSQKWEVKPSPDCACPGYSLIYRQGSLALFGLQPTPTMP